LQELCAADSFVSFFGLVGEEGDAQLFVHHQREDTHLGCPALVEFDCTLLELGFLIKGVPSEIEVVVAEVA
jgi:hypothetical protein